MGSLPGKLGEGCVRSFRISRSFYRTSEGMSLHMELPRVTVVIPTRDRVDALRDCLGRITPLVDAHPECEIIVSDDGDATATRAMLAERFPTVHVVQGPSRGPAANRNYGAGKGKGDLIVFLDDDCIPETNIVEVYQWAARDNPSIDVFEGRITTQGKMSSFADTAPENETGGFLWSCNFAIRRTLFDRLHGFDERYPFAAMEDVDLRVRLKALTSMKFLPDARVWHPIQHRAGWRTVKHGALSVLLYLHIHGREKTGNSLGGFLRSALRIPYKGAIRYFKGERLKDAGHLVRVSRANLQLALMMLGWEYRRTLAPAFFRPCCKGCESVLAVLGTERPPDWSRPDSNSPYEERRAGKSSGVASRSSENLFIAGLDVREEH